MTHCAGILTPGDRVLAALTAGLGAEFGRAAGAALAHRFLAAEETDFYWDARLEERWAGRFEAGPDDDVEVDCVVILGLLAGSWFVATMVVDGEGQAQGMMGQRAFRRYRDAARAFAP